MAAGFVQNPPPISDILGIFQYDDDVSVFLSS